MGEYSSFSLNGKVYTREELIEIGREHYPKFYWITRGIGIGLMTLGVLTALIFLVTIATVGNGKIPTTFYPLMGGFFAISLIGVILFGASFKRESDEAYISYAERYLTKYYSAHEKRSKAEEKDNVEQLLNYKKLLDAGVITQEEFDKKKKELL